MSTSSKRAEKNLAAPLPGATPEPAGDGAESEARATKFQQMLTALKGVPLGTLGGVSARLIRGRMDRLPKVLFSIRVKLSFAVIGMILVTIAGLSYFILKHQGEQLYRQTVTTGKISLTFFVANSRVPLLNDNILALNTLVKEASQTEGLLYAVISDREGKIVAHTDPHRIGAKLERPPGASAETKEGDITYFNYVGEKRQRVLNLASPIDFNKIKLGRIDVGISLDFIDQQTRKEALFILLLSLFILGAAVVVAVVLAHGFSQPISKLVRATQEIGAGNYQYKITEKRTDELGQLAASFNYMSDELFKKQLMQGAFGKYVGSDVLDMIMANPENAMVKGTQSEASVLFTDIRGFTSFSEKHSAEQVVESLNEMFEICTRAIIENGGYVDKFIGDAVLGVFGVPVPHADHVERAVRACIAMQDELKARAGQGKNLILDKVGIGLNAGTVVSGNIGSSDKMEYTVIGDAVNVASRLNGVAESGDIIVSDSIVNALGDRLKVKPLEPTKLKGKAEPVMTYKVIALN